MIPFSSLLSILFRKPRSAEAYYNLAVDHFFEQAYEKALSELEKAEAIDPQMPEVHYTKGLCFQHLNQHAQAKQAYQQALSLFPEDWEALYNLARLHYVDSELEMAHAYCEQAQTLVEDQGDDMISYLMGLICEEQGLIEPAIEAYEKSLALNPNQQLLLIFVAKLYSKLQQYPRAIALFQEALEIDPNHLECNYELSLCLAKTGEWEDTIRYCKKVVEIDPRYIKAYNQLGLAMYCTERLDEAIIYYQKALEIDPGYATALNNLAYTYEKMKNFDVAIQKFTEYLRFTEPGSDEKKEIEAHIELLQKKLLEV